MRAMDLLVSADAQGEVSEAVFFAAADLLNLEVDLIFFGTTSTYSERDGGPDPAGEQGLRRFGHSKDHRRDFPQIVIGLGGHPGGHPGALLGLAGRHLGHDGDRAGQGRPAVLAAGPGRHALAAGRPIPMAICRQRSDAPTGILVAVLPCLDSAVQPHLGPLGRVDPRAAGRTPPPVARVSPGTVSAAGPGPPA